MYAAWSEATPKPWASVMNVPWFDRYLPMLMPMASCTLDAYSAADSAYLPSDATARLPLSTKSPAAARQDEMALEIMRNTE